MSTAPESGPGRIRVEVVYATRERQVLVALDVEPGCTVQEAIARSGLDREFPGMQVDPDALGVFGRKVPPDHVLSPGDRVEIYRPLVADPKEARRKRAEKPAGAAGGED